MKLYAWKPNGYGEYSFFVCAGNEQQARTVVDAHIESLKDDEYFSDYVTSGWGTDYYELTVVEPLNVITNCND